MPCLPAILDQQSPIEVIEYRTKKISELLTMKVAVVSDSTNYVEFIYTVETQLALHKLWKCLCSVKTTSSTRSRKEITSACLCGRVMYIAFYEVSSNKVKRLRFILL
jgi:hypothetical protein